ncbi:hypothetical protein K443DRAFT_396350 [Laccaria amethystina LaAM-08-1]|uniref:Uncharacterized protein n=1 Tax=Laccaria amethystina LaAM-08-1 TaxID=1095629 RepID=A0A0C9WIT5_9AGAR|nr:hypothetical protein K443DRAFT_396350 [Laccaria amethystina LaAM-08-1]
MGMEPDRNRRLTQNLRLLGSISVPHPIRSRPPTSPSHLRAEGEKPSRTPPLP